MKKLILLLLFIPLVSFGQDDEKKGLNNILKQVKKLAKEYVKDGDIKMIKVDTIAYEYDIKKIGNLNNDIERYKVYNTDNIYTSLLLDTATGQIWQLQIGIGDDSAQMKTVLSDYKWATTLEELNNQYNREYKVWEEDYNSKPDSIVSIKDKKLWKPSTVEERLNKYKTARLQKNGRFKLYPTQNMYNFIMVDVIDGRTWQVQWNIDKDKRLIYSFY